MGGGGVDLKFELILGSGKYSKSELLKLPDEILETIKSLPNNKTPGTAGT